MKGPGAPLLVSNDDALLTDLARLAAAASVFPAVARDVAAAIGKWSPASVVVVGADLADALASAGPRRRPRVHVVARGQLDDSVFRSAIGCGADSVFALPEGEARVIEVLTDAGDGALTAGSTIGVIAGTGGAGATVFAAALASVCARREPTILVDADPFGSGIDRVVGMESVAGIRWDALPIGSGRLSARSLRDALPKRGDLAVLSWPAEHAWDLNAFAVRETLSASQRGFTTVIVDLPRWQSSVSDELIARCDHVVLVSTLTVPAVAAVVRVARRLAHGSTHLVLRGVGVGATDIEELLGLPVLAAMANQRGLDEAIGLGLGPLRARRGPLARAAGAVADGLLGPPGP
jgi:secretion/DNA translocation related CpaE-like protein